MSRLDKESKRQALIKLSQFVIGKRTVDMRDKLQEAIVEIAFVLSPAKNIKEHKIQTIIETQIFPMKISSEALHRTLTSLIQQNRVKTDGAGNYWLEKNQKQSLQERIDSTKSQLDRISNSFLDMTQRRFGKKLTTASRERTVECFYSFIYILLSERARFVAEVMKAGSSSLSVSRIEFPSSMLDNSIAGIHDTKLRNAVKNTIIEIFATSTTSFNRFLWLLAQNLVCMNILNLDPDCQVLERNALAQKIMFVDTNLIIGLLCKASWNFLASTELVDLTNMLGVRLVITPQTVKEFFKVLEKANIRYNKINVKKSFLKLIDDPFISSFAKESEKHPSQTWEGYYMRMKKLPEILRTKYNIEFYPKSHPEIKNKDFFKELVYEVSQAALITRSLPKKEEVAEHDAYHMLLVKEFRTAEKPTVLGPEHWFLTYDRTLPYVDDFIEKKFEYTDKASPIMFTDIWLHIITPFLGEDIRNKKACDVFIALLRSQIVSAPKALQADTIEMIQGEWLRYDWLSDEAIESILHQEFVREYTAHLRKAEEAEEDTEKITEEFKHKLNTAVLPFFNQQIQKARKELDQRDISLQKLDAELQNKEQKLEKTGSNLKEKEEEVKEKEEEIVSLQDQLASELRFRRFWRSICGISAAGLIVVSLLVMIYSPPSSLWTTLFYIACLILAAFLLLITIAYEQVKATLHGELKV